jgi:hypothetical protein
MVEIWVQVVDTNGIDAHDLHEGGISLALLGLAQRIRLGVGEGSAASGLIGDADDLEFLARLGVVEVLSLDLQRRNGSNERRGERDGG